jgi:hypothetical protein
MNDNGGSRMKLYLFHVKFGPHCLADEGNSFRLLHEEDNLLHPMKRGHADILGPFPEGQCSTFG